MFKAPICIIVTCPMQILKQMESTSSFCIHLCMGMYQIKDECVCLENYVGLNRSVGKVAELYHSPKHSSICILNKHKNVLK